MRTTKVLLSAVAIAASLLTSQAQSNVYSANVVGYYNIDVPGSKFVMLSQQLPIGGTDSLINDTITNGVPEGSLLFLWNGTGYDSIQFFAGFGWFDIDFNFVTNTLPPGKGAFFQNGDVSTATLTIVGQVPQGGATNVIVPNFNVYSIPTSLSTNVDAATVGSLPSTEGDLIFLWDVPLQKFNSYQFFEGFGWFDTDFNQVFPTPKVGEGFFYQHVGGSSNWTFQFSVTN
jgi:hypothetical protein